MDNKYLVDLRYLVDLSKIKVCIEISNCIEYENPLSVMDNLTRLLDFINNNQDYMPKKININVFNSLLKKVKLNRDFVYELDTYINESSEKLKKDKGWDKTDLAKVGIPRSSFEITLQELIIFYKVLESLENCYNIIKDDTILFFGEATYFNNIKTIKNMLEKRLAYAILNIRVYFKE